ncbi:MAG: hypothetical protein KQ78_01935 [Candidatus Izimaplasma bacterium HR2]|nr:MAG: hypothetical protein KQ78_01935 [Candidatus Izimaplasma bacterium HR2]
MTECHLTQMLAYQFFESDITEKVLELTIDHIYSGAKFLLVPHVDIGRNGETKKFIKEVYNMFRAMGVDVKIKPDSYAASGYADKYSKW